MDKFELDDHLTILYKSRKKEPFFVHVPSMNYITYNGAGHPSENDFQMACEALFSLSYIIKFKIVRSKSGIDYKVNPMEVDWFLDKTTGKISFTWIMMIMQPHFITEKMYNEGLLLAKETKKDVDYSKVAFETKKYGKCIQCFHAGDYNKMNDTMHKMFDFGKENGCETEPFTHDVYLNDSRKTKVENLKTIMRVKILENK
jgi:hypothetical protein